MRLAAALVHNDPATTVTIFLMADAVLCAKQGKKTPDGYYNLERMMKHFTTGNHRLRLCGACTDPRDLSEAELIAGASRNSMDELAVATIAADKVLNF